MRKNNGIKLVNMFALALLASAVMSQTGCASPIAHPVAATAQDVSTALPPNPVQSFIFSISEGQNKWQIGTQLQTPTTVGRSATRPGHCQFNGAQGEKADMTFNMVDGTSISVVPLQQTPKGVVALIRIETSSSHVDSPATSWEIGNTTHACSMPQGTSKSEGIMTSLVLDYGKPEKLTLVGHSVYEITASPGPL
jgi:hypothetical protein